jgi:2,4-dichlorophenol 6-monooxygenase
VNAQVAPRYSSDNVFCMGDAVHRHPPTNGLGLNMSVADAFNLAWKLALVEQGSAGAALLDTYSSERQPVGSAGVRRAITSLAEAGRFEGALGFTPDQSEDEGWAELGKLDDPGPEGAARRAALQEQLRIAQNQFNAHGFDLGYCYEQGALVHDGSTYSTNPGDPVLHHHPTTRPGARVPHARLELDGTPCSTLDLVDGLSFGLFVGLDHEAWSDAAVGVAASLGIGILVHRIGGVGGILDAYGEWVRVREVGDDGCVLVRPDRHVGWRSLGAVPDATVRLEQVMRMILAR